MNEDEELELLQLEKEKSFSQQSQKPNEFIKQPKTLGERAKDVGISTAIGGAAGAFSPEIAYGAGRVLEKVPYTPVQMAGRAMKSASIGMDTGKQRALGSLAGGFSGATSETAGQVAEAAGAPPYIAESARVLGSFAPIEILTTGAKGASGLIKYFSPTAAKASVLLRGVMDDVGVANLAGAKREEVMRRINELRQAPFTTDAQKKLYDVIAKDVQTMTGSASREAQALERSGTREGLEAQRRAKGFAGLSGEVTETKATILQRAKDSLRNLGDATRELSDVGRTLRDRIVARFDEQSLNKSEAYLKQKKIRDDAVRAKEDNGILVNSLDEFKTMMTGLRSKLLADPRTGKVFDEAKGVTTAPVTEQGLLKAYENIYQAAEGRRVLIGVDSKGNKAYKTYPTSFEALDVVRRKLGDVAFGKEVAGYEGLTRKVAEDYYIKISNIQSKYAGEAQDVLQKDYEIASRLIDKFKTKAGAKATAMDRIDATKFASDDKALPSTFFNSRQSVADAIELVGDAALVERQAADFVAGKLNGMNASAARTWITSKQNSDFLSALPNVRRSAEAYITNLERAEARAAGAAKVEGRLGAEERQAAGEAIQAPKIGAKEAKKVTDEAKAEAKTILGKAEPARRIKQILMSEDATLWDRIAPAIAASPNGKQILGESVRQALADRAEQGIFGTMRFYEESLMDSLTRTGLLGKQEADQILRQLKEISNVSIGETEKLTFMGRLIKNAIVGYGIPAIPRAATGTINTIGDVINQRGQINSAAPNLGAR
jgi:hypothetical protein